MKTNSCSLRAARAAASGAMGLTAVVLAAALDSAWTALDATRAASVAGAAQVEAAEIARQGVVREQEVGLATTLDVLISQQDVIDARVALERAERDAVVAGYSVLSAIGRLRAEPLALDVEAYDPTRHFEAVDGQWYGTRARD